MAGKARVAQFSFPQYESYQTFVANFKTPDAEVSEKCLTKIFTDRHNSHTHIEMKTKIYTLLAYYVYCGYNDHMHVIAYVFTGPRSYHKY